jgi:hypothetical protein
MHDCDIAGYLIADKLKHGSSTYRMPIDVIDIGLTVEDVIALDKAELAEEVKYDNSYGYVLSDFPQSARDFFDVKERNANAWLRDGFYYRRVEINALTNDELLEFIREKVDETPVTPDTETLHHYINTRHNRNNEDESVLKDAIYNAVLSHYDFSEDERISDLLEIDTDAIANKIIEKLDDGVYHHWTEALDDAYNDVRSEVVEKLADHIDMSIFRN